MCTTDSAAPRGARRGAVRQQDREQAWMKEMSRVGEWLEHVERTRRVEGLDKGVVLELRCRLNTGDEGDTLLTIKAQDETGKWVAFVGARNLVEAILTWRQKEGASGLKWRLDRPWSEREQPSPA